MSLLLRLFPALDHYCVLQARLHLFERIAENVSRPPGPIDITFGHAQYWHPVKVEPFGVNDNSLVIQVNPVIHGERRKLFYSIWVTGDFIRIGAIMDNEAALAPLMEGQQEINKIWPDQIPETQDRDGSLMYQWSFQVPGLLDRWSARHMFVDGVRHMHIRLLRILHDGLQPQQG